MHYFRILPCLLICLVVECLVFASTSWCWDKETEIAPFPVIYYSPETSLGLGAMAVVTFRDKDGDGQDRPDSISLIGSYTLENQMSVLVSPDLFFNDQKGELKCVAGYADMPTRFYGIGNGAELDADELSDLEEEYAIKSSSLAASFVHQVYRKLRLGMNYQFKNNSLYDKEDDNRIDGENLPGSDGGVTSGVGPSLDWDSRDNMFYPTSGGWYRLDATFFRDWLGSDFEYSRYMLDLRYFFTLKAEHILAVQAVAAQVDGDVPFYELLFPLIRGVDNRFFVDEKMVTFQAEYRFPIHRRFSGAAFIAVGDAQRNWSDFELEEIKYGCGAGIRYALNPNEKINIRFDISVSPWGAAPYIALQEMF
jgi:hypothetical protein